MDHNHKFSDMYDHVEQVMVDSKIASCLSQPEWMDKQGNIVSNKDDGVGCKVEVKLD